MIRCAWCGDDPLYTHYHDYEWGKEVHDETKLFEFLLLESFQAGLSWISILRKRENFRVAFDHFDLEKISQYDEVKFMELMNNQGIIRNKLKIRAAIHNAKICLEMHKIGNSLNDFFWSYVDFKPIDNKPKQLEDIAVNTKLSDRISKDLKKMGFKFIGSTTVYSFMQAIGMVNDHIEKCAFR